MNSLTNQRDDMVYFAHSENSLHKKHELKKHLLATAELTKSFAPQKTLHPLFYLAGLLHDVGKFQDGFQKYLENGTPKTPHAGIGAFLASRLGKQCLPLQFVIQGHHAGMPDNEYRRSNNDDYSEMQEVVDIVRTRFEATISDSVFTTKRESLKLPNDGLITESITRFLFSALTDADWLDTEHHFDPEKSSVRSSTELNHDTLLNALEKEFALLPRNGEINKLRTEARTEATSHYANPPGFFSLQLPTGLGKTLTSAYWALLHARENKLKRIIIVLPYINIIDQTASILKDIFDEEVILEHHSGVIEDDEEYSKETFKKGTISTKQLACENWQAPIIVTTAVQFFESLFSNRPFKCRKNHSIANSVVIFDEIQTLPKQLAEPTIVMLKNVAAVARTTFLFCTATMPAFGKRDTFDGIESMTSLIRNPKKYFNATLRVEYKLLKKLQPLTLDVVSQKLLKETKSYLVVVNTKIVAKELYSRLKEGNTHEQYYHLSTAMCPHHRKKTIGDIVAALDPKNKRRIAVVSTQLVEAGVDFDFPCVYRAIAPLDSIIQAAGRCNRNGRMKKGKVVLFDLVDHRMPDSTYRACAAFAKGIIQDDPEVLHSEKSFERYYEQVIQLFVNPDKFGITGERKNFNFKTVNDQYQIIERGRTVPLLIADYSSESKALSEEVLRFFGWKGFILKEQYSKLQQYSVQVYKNFLEKHNKQIEVHESGLRLWHGGYNEDFGLAPEDIETVF